MIELVWAADRPLHNPADVPDRAGGIVSVGRARLGAGPAGDRPYVIRLESPVKGTLVLAILNVKSSYVAETEEPLNGSDDVPDTLQWWIASDNAFRIKTFAVDHDIHIHGLTKGGPPIVEMALANNSKNYGDVIARQHVIELEDCNDADTVAKAFGDAGLTPSLDVEPGQFAFWKPDEAEYKTLSRPK
jgi:hypothetical protein